MSWILEDITLNVGGMILSLVSWGSQDWSYTLHDSDEGLGSRLGIQREGIFTAFKEGSSNADFRPSFEYSRQ